MRENTRNTRRARTAAIPSSRSAGIRASAERSGQAAGRLTGRRLSMEEALSAGRARSLEAQATHRPQAQADDAATAKAGAALVERSSRPWLRDRSVDVEPDCRGDRQAFAVSYDPSGVWHILKAMGRSCQKPERRARESDEDAMVGWRQQTWPQIKKSPSNRSKYFDYSNLVNKDKPCRIGFSFGQRGMQSWLVLAANISCD